MAQSKHKVKDAQMKQREATKIRLIIFDSPRYLKLSEVVIDTERNPSTFPWKMSISKLSLFPFTPKISIKTFINLNLETLKSNHPARNQCKIGIGNFFVHVHDLKAPEKEKPCELGGWGCVVRFPKPLPYL